MAALGTALLGPDAALAGLDGQPEIDWYRPESAVKEDFTSKYTGEEWKGPVWPAPADEESISWKVFVAGTTVRLGWRCMCVSRLAEAGCTPSAREQQKKASRCMRACVYCSVYGLDVCTHAGIQIQVFADCPRCYKVCMCVYVCVRARNILHSSEDGH